MDTIKTDNLLRALVLFLFSGILYCCTDERESYNTLSGGKEKTVSFSLKVPGSGTPKTYALIADDENKVESVAVLLFDGSGNYTYQPIYSNSITTDSGDSRLKTFTVKVPEGTYGMVILANANQSLATALSSITTGDSKAAVLSKLLLSNSGKWNATPGSSGYVSIPMWGEITNIVINSDMPTGVPVTLSRMISKIDVSLTTSAAKNNFNLTSVRLYNYNNQGRVAPDAANWNSTTGIATAPSVPAGAVKLGNPTTNPVTPALLYDGIAITKDPEAPARGISCTGEIYTFESNTGSSADHLNNTCLVIGGHFMGETAETYYRIDLANTTDGVTTYLPLLRNHHYKVNIADVKNSGLATYDEAFKSRPVNIEASVINWNDGDISDIVFDGQYMLGVSKTEFTFTREERTISSTDNILSVTTDYPTGWTVEKIVDASGSDINLETNPSSGWLKLSPATGASGSTISTQFVMLENSTGSTRNAFIHLRAGRLTYVLNVTQTAEAAWVLMLRDGATNTTEITELNFVADAGVTPQAQSVKLSWIPATLAVQVSTATFGSNAFVYNTGSGLATPGAGSETSYSDPSGIKTLNIQPTAFTAAELTANPFLEKISKVDFMLNNGVGGLIAKSVFLRQFAYNFRVEETADFYRMDGSTYTLRVKSNTGWKISSVTQNVVSGTGDLLQSVNELHAGFTGGVNTNPGTAVTFQVVNNVSLKGTLTITFVSTDSPARFADKTLVLMMGEYYPDPHTGWAGSNIYWDGSKLTFDGVGDLSHKNYQGVYFQWGSLTGIAPNGSNPSAWSTSILVYKPGASSGVAGGSWSSWPRVSDAGITSNPPSGKSARDRAYLYEITDGSTGVGDICKYLTEKGYAPGSPTIKWRLPTSQEFDTASGGYTQSGTSWAGVTSTSAAGTFQNTNASGVTKTDTGTPFFPAAGFRNNATGQLNSVGFNGNYWSGSPNGTNGYYLLFTSSSVSAGNYGSRAYGFSVRCVRE